ncbi:unnamed protein product [Prorocentrum cordatum]|uniref:Uncharacterized protein n=1 Tax=Prorocentrum cordatum TaxID=2364126 RepID=A0ABN9T3F9_9DINO|nr:unnamed protein product [Polarella glacialis]
MSRCRAAAAHVFCGAWPQRCRSTAPRLESGRCLWRRTTILPPRAPISSEFSLPSVTLMILGYHATLIDLSDPAHCWGRPLNTLPGVPLSCPEHLATLSLYEGEIALSQA